MKTKGRKKAKGEVALSAVNKSKLTPKVQESDRDFVFSLQVGTTTLILAANSQPELQGWVRPLQEILAGATDMTKETVEIQDKLSKGQTSAGLEIDPATIEFSNDSQIGSGASGIVRRGTWLGTTSVAIKALKNLPEFTDNKELTSFFREIEVLSGLRHVNILQMFGYCKKEKYLCLVTEYVRDGSLSDKLKAHTPTPLWKQVDICRGVAAGMSYLHNLGFIHRDLKPANILIANWNEGLIKVCDFGLSVKSTNKDDTETTFGSPQYAAPELSKKDHTEKVDVFSFAIVLWELTVGSPKNRPLWPDVKFGWMFAQKYSKGERPPVEPDETPFYSLLVKVWQTEPQKRPTFPQVYQDLEQISEKVGKRPEHEENNNSINSPVISGTLRGAAAQPKVATIESQLLAAFQGKSSLGWNEFSSVFQSNMNANPDEVNKLRYLLVERNAAQVPRTNLERFMNWFRPLAVRDFYQTNDDSPESMGYTIETILQIASPLWFHGFLGSSTAQQMLRAQPDGTYLFRFSTTSPGDYALSCSYNNHVGHWRISCQLSKTLGVPVFSIDGRNYDSLQDIIFTHSLGKEPLKVKEHKPNQPNSINLMSPHNRPPPSDTF